MKVKNFLDTRLEPLEHCHEGIGTLKNCSVFGKNDFQTKIGFLNYTVLPPGTTIGKHKHGDDEEMYFILEGAGEMTVDGEVKSVKAGDVIVNKPYGAHGLSNNSGHDLRILVLGVSH